MNQLSESSSRTAWPLRRAERDPLEFLLGLAASTDDVVPFQIGRRHAYLLNHPARVEDVLIRQRDAFVKGPGFNRAKVLLGTGLLTAEGDLHRQRRRMMHPSFHREQIERHVPAVVGHAVRCRDAWREGEPVDLAREMSELTLTVACDVLFGTRLPDWAVERIRSAVTRALSPMDGLMAMVAPPAGLRRARRDLDDVVEAIVAARRQSLDEHDDLLALLLDHQDGSLESERQLQDDVLTFLLASHDTLSHALTWTWLLLSTHPDVDARLDEELADVLSNRLPDVESMGRLRYTRAVVAEALRLFPPAWVIVRRATRACRLGTTPVHAGEIVVASAFVSHRDHRFFPDPLRFTPERWLKPAGGSAEAMPKLAYFPFGAGPRACIGEGFAWMEATLVLATLAQRWRMSRSTSVPFETCARVTLRPGNEPPMMPSARLTDRRPSRHRA